MTHTRPEGTGPIRRIQWRRPCLVRDVIGRLSPPIAAPQECTIMMEQAAAVLDGDPMEFPGGNHSQQRPPKAGLRGMDVRRDLFTGRPAPDPQAGPAGSHTGFAASARIIAAADQARRRIERDLHDGLQQRLVSLGLRARLAQASVPAG
jgi:signal transduction histidine kinase